MKDDLREQIAALTRRAEEAERERDQVESIGDEAAHAVRRAAGIVDREGHWDTARDLRLIADDLTAKHRRMLSPAPTGDGLGHGAEP
jgi:hypothetical protein